VNWLVPAAGATLIGTGLTSILATRKLSELLTWFRRTRRYGVAIVLRIAVGLAVLFGAQSSRYPTLAIMLGLLFLIGASAVPLLGEDRIAALLDWWTDRHAGWLRAWGTVMLCLGVFLVWLGFPGIQ
jgi:hypothetical protein